MSIEEQHTRVEKLLGTLPDGNQLREMLAVGVFPIQAEHDGYSAVPSNRRTSSKRRGND